MAGLRVRVCPVGDGHYMTPWIFIGSVSLVALPGKGTPLSATGVIAVQGPKCAALRELELASCVCERYHITVTADERKVLEAQVLRQTLRSYPQS